MPQSPATALLDAARTLANHDPSSPAELADLLRALNDLTDPGCLTALLADAFERWAAVATEQAWPKGEMVAEHLGGASDRLFAIGEHLDKARENTGHY